MSKMENIGDVLILELNFKTVKNVVAGWLLSILYGKELRRRRWVWLKNGEQFCLLWFIWGNRNTNSL